MEETRLLPPVRDEEWAESAQGGEDCQRKHSFPVTQSKSTRPGRVLQTTDDPGRIEGDQPTQQSAEGCTSEPKEGCTLEPDEGCTSEPNPAVEQTDETYEGGEEEEETDEAVSPDGCAPTSAKSDISLVGFPSESEHRALVRRVKAVMKERLQNATERQTKFQERRSAALRRSQELAVSKAARQKQHCSQSEADNTATSPITQTPPED